jgi:hypothetical protein
LIGFWGGGDLELQLNELLMRHFLVLDVGPDHFLIAADGRDKISASPEFVAQEISHLAFDVLAIQIELFPFIYPMICATPQGDSITSFPQL